MGIVEQEITQDQGADPNVIQSINPSNGSIVGTVRVCDTEAVLRAVNRAKLAQASWSKLPLSERQTHLLRYRTALIEHTDEILSLLCRENGKPRQEALLHELVTCADIITYFCKIAPDALAPQQISLRLLKHRKSYVHFAPRGVIGVISPWNFPLVTPMSSIVPALLTGSAVIVKPSEATPLIAMLAKRIWDELSLPADLFQVVPGYAQTARDLIHAGVDLIHFTGSVAAGRSVGAACGEKLIPCVLELGGKAPLIACNDADIELTAKAIVFGGFANCGQICVSVERVYAHQDIHDRLVSRVLQLVGELRQGDPDTNEVEIGAMTIPAQVRNVEALIADALSKGAVLRCGGARLAVTGQFFPPTVLTNCDHSMRVMSHETFGPIVPFMKVRNDDEALRLANDSHLGLNAYVFSTDRNRALGLAEQIRAGSVLVNDVLNNYACPETPFGGLRSSGVGRVHGEESLREVCEMRHVNYDRFAPPSKNPIMFPYTPERLKWFIKAMRSLFSGGNLVSRIGEWF